MPDTFLSVVVPAYNEANRIQNTLLAVSEYLKNKNFSYEIIVVNDGSDDETAQIVQGILETVPNLKLIDNKENRGKGHVIRQGMLEAQGRLRLFTDADNSTPIEQLDAFLPCFKEGYDIVVSSRRVPGAVVEQSQRKIRTWLGHIFNRLVHTLVPLRVNDSQNGFKIFTADAATIVFTKQTTVGWAFDVEILAIASLYGLKVKEQPIRWINDDRSHMTLKGMVGMLQETLSIKFNLMNVVYGVYDPKFGDIRLFALGKFLVFGALNTLVDWLWYFALTRTFFFFATHLVLAKGVAFLIGSIPIFISGAYWVFPDPAPVSLRDLVKVYAILTCAFIINIVSLSIFLSIGLPDIFAVVLATGTSFIWNLTVAWVLIIKDRIKALPLYQGAYE